MRNCKQKTPFLMYTLFVVGFVAACSDPSDDPVCIGVNITEVRNAATLGLVEAQNELGQRYQNGECVDRDFTEAARWYQLAAENGHVNAQKVLGFMYAGGMGVDRDNDLSLVWFRTAAKNGHPEAQFGLATAYFRGIGVNQDKQMAAEWFQKSANQNYDRSQYNLGNLYEIGQGVPQEPIQAYFWYGLANRNGYPKAAKAMVRLEDYLPADMIETTRIKIHNWTPSSSSKNEYDKK